MLVPPPRKVPPVYVLAARFRTQVPAPVLAKAPEPAITPAFVRPRPLAIFQVCAAPSVTAQFRTKPCEAADISMPEAPKVRVPPALIVTGAPGLEMVKPSQLVSAPS